MVIGIDGNEANIDTRVGVGQFAYQILKELHRQNQHHTFLIFLKNPPLPDMPRSNQHWRYLVFGPKPLWTKIALPIQLTVTKEKIDYFLSLSHYSPQPSPVPTIPTIHDIGYLKSPDSFTKKDIFQLKNWTAASIKHAAHILTVSEFTKNEVIDTFHVKPSQITIIRNGVGQPPKTTKTFDTQVLHQFGLHQPYFLSVGTLKPNKNYPFLIKAFAKFLLIFSSSHLQYSLVIAGKKGWLFDEIFQVVTHLNLTDRVIFTDFITEQEKWALYRQATATVIPSLYEGFGIPALESQRVGTPVLASAISPLKEVLHHSAIYLNPTKISSLVKAFQKITHSQTQKKYRHLGLKNSAGYTWAKSAQQLLQLFDRLAGV